MLESSRTVNKTHGLSGHELYHVWCKMLDRCRNKHDPSYANYGGRGIYVCERWKGPDGFPNFLADMGERPSPNHSIDRHPDNNGPYSKDNCRWATRHQQAKNKRNNRWFTVNGEQIHLAECTRRSCLTGQTVQNLADNGMDMTEILSRFPAKP
jgi:hypothetical protein